MGRHSWLVSGSPQQQAASHLRLTWSRAPPGLAFVTANSLDTGWKNLLFFLLLPFPSVCLRPLFFWGGGGDFFPWFLTARDTYDPDKSSAIVAVTGNMWETLFCLSPPSVDISGIILQLPLHHLPRLFVQAYARLSSCWSKDDGEKNKYRGTILLFYG